MSSFDLELFLAPCDVIDWPCAPIRELARRFTSGAAGVDAISAMFAWVRDAISHTADVGHGKLTLRASEVLRERTGLCYAKSHLLVALLRASNVPAGLCYQRLRCDDSPRSFVLHGLVAAMMPDRKFLRMDPRGNKPGVDAQLRPHREALAFTAALPGEVSFPGVFARPHPAVVSALSAGGAWHPRHTQLPDAKPEDWPVAEAEWATPLETP
jgi:transglutaminase-like putative cysteine protease